MRRPLDEQKRIDLLAIIFTSVLAIIIDFVGSFAIGIVPQLLALIAPQLLTISDGVDYGFFIMISSLFFLSPFWFWIALKVRRAIGWPRGAFEPSDFI
jgi:hypothetical protein